MIRFPLKPEEAVGAGTIRAGGTDLGDRRRRGSSSGELVDLRDVPGLDLVEVKGKVLRIGAMVRLADLAVHPEVRARAPLLALAAGSLATPQIRAVATLGGNLLQGVRCWYFRSPEFSCLRKGGATCFARGGDHRNHAVFDQSACVAVHASTVGMALLAWDEVKIRAVGSAHTTLQQLYGDGTAAVDHHLEPGALLTGIELPEPWPDEKVAYLRAISRFEAEWPIVEAGVRLALDADGAVKSAAVVVGAVSSLPRRLPAVEAALVGQVPTAALLAAAAAHATDGASPLAGTKYKLQFLVGTVQSALERALGIA